MGTKQTIPLQRTIYGNTYCRATKPPQCLVKIQISGLPLLSIESRCTHREEAQGWITRKFEKNKPKGLTQIQTGLRHFCDYLSSPLAKIQLMRVKWGSASFPGEEYSSLRSRGSGSEYMSWHKLFLWAKKLPALCFCSGIFPWLQARAAAGRKPPPYGAEPLTLCSCVEFSQRTLCS